MSDALVTLGKNRFARNLIGKAGLPIPLPQELRRGEGPWSARPLEGRGVYIGGEGELTEHIGRTLARAGADLFAASEAIGAAVAEPAEGWSRPLAAIADAEEGTRPHALVFDATGITDVAGLRGVYEFFHTHIRALGRCGRVVVIGRPAEHVVGVAAAAAQEALVGFTRSVAKEIGRKGSTANYLAVEPGAGDLLEGPLRWLLSDRSAFVTGQPALVHAAAMKTKSLDAPYVRPLEGKVVLVTGAAQGIGASIARRMAEEGAKVVGVDRPAEGERMGPLMSELGGVAVLVDLTDADAPDTVAAAIEELGGVDVIVHNAGVTRDKTLGRMDDARWDLTLAVNLEALLRLDEVLVPKLLRDGGRIVNLASIAGIAGNVGQTNYAASKSGVIGLTRALSAELAGRGITVNAVAPGFIETRLTAAIPVATREPARRLSSLGQGGQPVDVAELITFLSTPGAQGLTGGVHRVCGQHLTGA